MSDRELVQGPGDSLLEAEAAGYPQRSLEALVGQFEAVAVKRARAEADERHGRILEVAGLLELLERYRAQLRRGRGISREPRDETEVVARGGDTAVIAELLEDREAALVKAAGFVVAPLLACDRAEAL